MLKKGNTIFSQGDKADAIYFVETGRVKISVVSTRGKEAVLVILAASDFFGEGCLVGQPLRISTAMALESSDATTNRGREPCFRHWPTSLDSARSSSRHFWYATSVLKKTSAISFSITANGGWRGSF
jgi:hypothetical protein